MLEYNRTLELILGQITLELTAIQMDLNRISLKRDFEQCKNDVLHLADTDVSLLAIYYIEAELEKREKLENSRINIIFCKNFSIRELDLCPF